MNNPFIKRQEYTKTASLEAWIKSDPDPRKLKRAIAIKMSIEGHSTQMIAQILGVSKSGSSLLSMPICAQIDS